MTPVPKKPGTGPSLNNARGVILSPVPGKAYAKVLRREAAPLLLTHGAELQFGSRSGGGVDIPSLAVRAFWNYTKAAELSAAILFTDVAAAFYSTLCEELLGPLLDGPTRTAALSHIGLGPAAVAAFEEAYIAQGPRLCTLGLAQGWAAAIADWHRHSWFCVRGGTNAVTLRTGTRPGDPLADLVFALNLVAIQLEVLAALRSAGLVHEVVIDATSVFSPAGIEEVTEVSLPTFMDDMVVLICCPNADEITVISGAAFAAYGTCCTVPAAVSMR